MKQGLIHIYTGTGKGKTTTSVGLAVRALSHNFKVCFCNFNKNPEKYGITELNTLEKLGATVMPLTQEHPRFNKAISIDEHKAVTAAGFDKIKNYIQENECDLLVMDEINISIRDNFLPEDELLQFLKDKPDSLEVVLTGRGATEKMMEIADYVSIIDAHKHPFEQGISSREGIEY
jgi:cob(I)alamin adenosyltransferase